MPKMERETYVEGQAVEVGATWHRPNKLIPIHVVIECVSVEPELFEGVLYIGGRPTYRSARQSSLDAAHGAAEAWLSDRLIALLAPDGIRQPGPGFYGPDGGWSPNSQQW